MDFSHKNLQGRSFKNQNLAGANFSYADLRGANFNNANLTGVNFSHAKTGVQFFFGIALVIGSFFLITFIIDRLSFFVANSLYFTVENTMGNSTVFWIFIISLINLVIFIIITNRRDLLLGLFAVVATITIVTILLIIGAMIIPNFFLLMSSGNQNFTLMGLVFPLIIMTVGTVALVLLLALGIVVSSFVTVYGGVVFTILAIPDIAISVVGSIVARSIYMQGNYEAIMELIAELDQKITSALNNPTINTLTFLDLQQFVGQIMDLAQPGIETTVSYAFIFMALPTCTLGVYIGWRTLAGDEQYEQIKNIAVISASLFGTRFRYANLTDANFTQAELKSTDLSKAILTRTCWKAAKQLHQARFINTYLENSKIRQLVITGDGKNKDFDGQNLQGLNLENANLENASFIRTDLAQANLRQANLAGTLLVETHLEEADLTGVSLTDTCIADWKITKTTRLDDIDCQYVYLKFINGQKSNRLPNKERDFQPGEFTDVIRSLFDGFNLNHTEGVNNVNTEAVVLALQKISDKYQELIEIIGIEKKEDAIVFKIKNHNPDNVERIKSEYPSQYKQALNSLQDNSGERLTQKEYESVRKQISQLLEEVKQPRTIHVEKIVVPEESILVFSEKYQTPQLPESPKSKTLVEKIQELKNIINLNSELIPTNLALALEQLENLEQAAQDPKDRLSQKTSRTAIRVIRGIISELPSSKLTQDYNKLLTYISDLFGSMNMTANESSTSPDNSKQQNPFVSIESFHSEKGSVAIGKKINMNIDQRKLKVGDGAIFQPIGSPIMSDNVTISGTVAETINQLPSSTNPNQPGIKELLSQLKKAIEAETELNDEDKGDALEEVQNLAEASQDSNETAKKTKAGKSLRILGRIMKGLPSAAAFVTICKELFPAISNFFGL